MSKEKKTEPEALKIIEQEERYMNLFKEGKGDSEIKEIIAKEEEALAEKEAKAREEALKLKLTDLSVNKTTDVNVPDLKKYQDDVETIVEANVGGSIQDQKEVAKYTNLILEDINAEPSRKAAYYDIIKNKKDVKKFVKAGDFLEEINNQIPDIPGELVKLWNPEEGKNLFVTGSITPKKTEFTTHENNQAKQRAMDFIHNNYYYYTVALYLSTLANNDKARYELRKNLVESVSKHLTTTSSLTSDEKYQIYAYEDAVNKPLLQYLSRMDINSIISKQTIEDFDADMLKYIQKVEAAPDAEWKTRREIFTKLLNEYGLNNIFATFKGEMTKRAKKTKKSKIN